MRWFLLLFISVTSTLLAHHVYVGGGVTVNVGHPYRYWHERVYVGDPWYNPTFVVPVGEEYYYPGYVEGRPYYYWDPHYYYY